MIFYLTLTKERDVLEGFNYLLLFILGAVFGSFLNVVIKRVPKSISIVSPRSYCFSCENTIKWYHNIPLISYLMLKGQCSYCEEKIPVTYFIVELLTACITIILFYKLGVSLDLLFSLLLFYTLIVLAFIDIEYKAVPDTILLLVLILGFFVSSSNLIDAFKDAFIFAGAFALLEFIMTFYIQNIKAKYTQDESLREQKSLGEGDIPVIAIIGAILGINGGVVAIFLASLFAIIITLFLKNKNVEIPFIPYLLLGFAVEYIFEISKVFS